MHPLHCSLRIRWWAGLKSERGNSFVEAVMEVMERRVQEAAAGGPGSPKHSVCACSIHLLTHWLSAAAAEPR